MINILIWQSFHNVRTMITTWTIERIRNPLRETQKENGYEIKRY